MVRCLFGTKVVLPSFAPPGRRPDSSTRWAAFITAKPLTAAPLIYLARMLFLIGCVVGLAAGLASGGSLRNLAELRFRWPWLVVVALLVKVAGTTWPLAFLPVTPYLYVVSLAALVAWAVWHAPRLPEMWLLAAGMALNLVVVVANDGHMPAYHASRLVIAYLQQGPVGQYVLGGPATRLGFLGDWIGVPGPLGTLFPEGYSPGDLLAIVAITVLVLMSTRRQPEPVR